MSLGKTWYRVEVAVEKFGVTAAQLEEWIEEGLVRTEQGEDGTLRLNGDDIELQSSSLVRDAYENLPP